MSMTTDQDESCSHEKDMGVQDSNTLHNQTRKVLNLVLDLQSKALSKCTEETREEFLYNFEEVRKDEFN